MVGTHTAAGPAGRAGTRIVDSYQAACTAGNHPVLGVALAGKRLNDIPLIKNRA